jgi:hypothetical protein
MTGRSLAAAACLLLVAAGCGDDGGDDAVDTTDGSTTTTEPDASGTTGDDAGTSPLGDVTTEAVGPEVFADMPLPPGNISGTTSQAAFAAWDGGAVYLGPAGGLVRFGPESGAEFTPTEGIDTGEEGTTERVVDVLASDGDTLLAIGHQEEFVADVIPTISTEVWTSTDGEAWEQVDAQGFESGTDTVSVTAVIADPEGGWTAGGEVDDGNQVRLALWHSDDGEQWEEVEVTGLDHTDTEEEGESLESLAVVDDTMLVVRTATGLDDERLSLLRGTVGEFEELDPTGLDDLDLPNSDIIPAVTAIDGQFVLFASVEGDDGEFGERTPALFTSDDGEAWTAVELDGPALLDPFSLQALTATDGGAIGLTEGEQVLDVWRFTDG